MMCNIDEADEDRERVDVGNALWSDPSIRFWTRAVTLVRGESKKVETVRLIENHLNKVDM
jgi:hypothetical protein